MNSTQTATRYELWRESHLASGRTSLDLIDAVYLKHQAQQLAQDFGARIRQEAGWNGKDRIVLTERSL